QPAGRVPDVDAVGRGARTGAVRGCVQTYAGRMQRHLLDPKGQLLRWIDGPGQRGRCAERVRGKVEAEDVEGLRADVAIGSHEESPVLPIYDAGEAADRVRQ